MWRFLLFLIATPALAEPVTVLSGETALRAEYARPPGAQRAGIVALHGCSGMFPVRDRFWRDQLVPGGYAMVYPDSFGSRGMGSQCKERSRTVTPAVLRRQDAYAAGVRMVFAH